MKKLNAGDDGEGDPEAEDADADGGLGDGEGDPEAEDADADGRLGDTWGLE